ncbi:MAG: type II toxin-antitoxin system RelE/ParE family toxin [Prevotellaceae bacterium]|jgi:mRNA interferase RelE/StbE|nr:type II toxin-antitoxin system RelE/ParE family toxin [Prevotellaceae bacterium]
MYKIAFKKSAEKDLSKINPVYYESVVDNIRELAYNPRPFGSVKLKGYLNIYRIRVGVYRVVYTIEDSILTIEVIKIDHRSSVYRP